MTHAQDSVSVQGALDADGHILEPPNLWEKYLEPKYGDRALRMRTNRWYYDVLVSQGMIQAFVSLFHYGLFDRFSMEELAELIEPLSETARRQILWENVSRVYAAPAGGPS